MSSMTLKEFMTRGNGGMEKDAADWPHYYLNPHYSAGYNDRLLYRKSNEVQSGSDMFSLAREALNNPGSMTIGLLLQFVPDLANGNPDVIKKLDRMTGEAQLGTTLYNEIRRIASESPYGTTVLSMATKNPEFFKSWVMRPLVSFLKNNGPKLAEKIDPEKLGKNAAVADNLKKILTSVQDWDTSDLKKFDMWQHTPGMAAAFGIPFGIGALLGHPGWGAMIGMLGAGGYGYYQYHKMRGANTATPQEKPQEKTEALPPPEGDTVPQPEGPADNVPDAPATADTPQDSTSKDNATTTGPQAQDEDIQGLENLDNDLPDSTQDSNTAQTTQFNSSDFGSSDYKYDKGLPVWDPDGEWHDGPPGQASAQAQPVTNQQTATSPQVVAYNPTAKYALG